MAQSKTARGNLLTYFLGLLALACIVGAAGDFFFVVQATRSDAHFLDQARVLEAQSQVLAYASQGALQGNAANLSELARSSKAISHSMDALTNGASATALASAGTALASSLGLYQRTWAAAQPAVHSIVQARSNVLVVARAASAVRAEMPTYVSDWNPLISAMVRRGYALGLVKMVAGQPVLADDTLSAMNTMFEGRTGLTAAANEFTGDTGSFDKVLTALVNGSPQLNINALPNDADLQKPLDQLQQNANKLAANLEILAPLANEIITWRQSANTLQADAPKLLGAAQGIARDYQNHMSSGLITPLYGYILGAIALVLIAILVVRYQLTGDARRAARAQQEQSERNQEAILALMDELGRLADGDLTVQLAVTEDITGTISDSINFTVEALRELVKTINDTAVEIDNAARQTETTASRLAEASENQSEQITNATHAISQMAQSAELVSENASRANDVARRSVDIAHKGGDAVRRTIDGMAVTRESIQETAKRMKRLGESSQEIGDIIELINDIAEQTNILALNAAIQASTAGEAGRGFGVVADEVQRLAERATGAVRQIETLVRTIQADTNEAILSMERSTSGVVSGAQLAENAGHSLDEIESVSNHISKLIDIISRSAREQAQVASEVSNTMGVIQEITSQTSEGTGVAAKSIGKLAALATKLRGSTSRFTLPKAKPNLIKPSVSAESDAVSESEVEANEAVG